jgi:predicted RNA-binding protein with PIN domain
MSDGAPADVAGKSADAHEAEAVGPAIEHRHLRSALEYAVLMAEETQKRKPPMPVPNSLRAFFGKPRIPAGALGRLRRAVDGDDVFRTRIAAGALPELVDDVGRLWLQRPTGWEAEAERLIAESERTIAEADAATSLRRAEKRRAAAEEAAVRSLAEIARLTAIVDEHQDEVDRLRADLTKADDLLAETRAELIDVRNEARHSRDREAAAAARLAAVSAERDALTRSAERSASSSAGHAASAGSIDDLPSDSELQALRDLADASARAATDASRRLADILGRRETIAAERAAATTLAEAGPPERHRRPGRRQPIALPGGIIASSAEAASFLARSGAAMIVDGYNVALLGWPNLTLEAGRSALIESMENLARRFGTDVTTVFDGAAVVGAHAGRRRLTRVVFSPAGVIADDVIRSEIDRLPNERHVVVVTNDAEVVRDARAAGCNVVSSNALLAVL